MAPRVKHIVYQSPDPAKARYCVYIELTLAHFRFMVFDHEVNDFVDDITVPFDNPQFAEQVFNSFW